MATIALCCNDHRNGFEGRFSAVHFELAGFELHVDCKFVDRKMKCDLDERGLHVGKLVVPIQYTSTWYGNWCWNSYTMHLAPAVDVWNHVQRTKAFTPESGAAVLWDLWEQEKQPLTLKRLREALKAEKERERSTP